MERQVVKNESLAQLKDILAGIFAGVGSKVLEYPLDTVKVLMQTSRLSSHPSEKTIKINPFKVFSDSLNEGGIRRLYRGLSAPLVGAAGENLVSFWLFAASERKLKSFFQTNQLSITQIGYCGMVAGFGAGLWLTPVEFIKCQMQVSQTAARYNNSTMECVRHNLLYKPSNLMTGLGACLIREIPGGFVYFVSYRGTTRLLQKLTNNESNEPPLWIVLSGGGMAGITFWTMVYPIDLIKSKLQSQDMFDHSHNSSNNSARMNGVNINSNGTVMAETGNRLKIWPLMVDRVKRYGVRSLFHGWSVASVRAVLTNALIFAFYEYSRKLLDTVIVDEFEEI